MKKVIALTAILVSAAQAQAAIPAGIYSNVCIYPETDDLGGVELQIAYANGKPTVLLWSCEGGCGYAQPTSGIALHGNQITFTAADQAFYPSGKVAQSILRRFTATAHGPVLTLYSPTYSPKRQHLQRQPSKKDIGNPKAQPIPTRRCR